MSALKTTDILVGRPIPARVLAQCKLRRSNPEFTLRFQQRRDGSFCGAYAIALEAEFHDQDLRVTRAEYDECRLGAVGQIEGAVCVIKQTWSTDYHFLEETFFVRIAFYASIISA